jgi:cystathionine beta-synthase
MTLHEHVTDLIGDTPLVRLRHVTATGGARVYAKLEYLNPGGSAKDRIALSMVRAAEADGLLRPGGTIVEPTSGNTGVGLAMVARRHGYGCVFTCPDKVSTEKIDTLRAFGAEVVVCPAAVPVEDPRSYRSTAARIAAERPGAVQLNQYANQANPAAHYHGTGPELWRQTDGRITCFVAGVGTGGTISGTGRYLKEVAGATVRVIGADPDGSVYSGAPVARPYLLEGVGQPSLPATYDPSVVDRVIAVPDREALVMTRRLAREEGVLTGGSGGMAVVAAVEVAAELSPDDLVVVLLPDSGRGYLTKVFNDGWMTGLGLLDPPGDQPRVRDAAGGLPLIAPHETLDTALKTIRSGETRHLLVSAALPPVRLAEIHGAVSDTGLLRALAGGAHPDEPVAGHLEPPPPRIGAGQPLGDAVEALREAPAVLAVEGGLASALLTAADVATAMLAAPGRTPAVPVPPPGATTSLGDT